MGVLLLVVQHKSMAMLGLVWFGMVGLGVVLLGMAGHGCSGRGLGYSNQAARGCNARNPKWHESAHGVAWCGLACYGLVGRGLVRYGAVGHGLVRYGVARRGMAWLVTGQWHTVEFESQRPVYPNVGIMVR